MARTTIRLKDHGIDMETTKFAKLMLGELKELHEDKLSVDKLVCRPQQAGEFCQVMRRKYGWVDVPDYVILEPMMNWRKKTKQAKART